MSSAGAISLPAALPVALATMEGARAESALVLEGEQLVGLLRVADIARAVRARAGRPPSAPA